MLLLIFVDGIGFGAPGPHNPFTDLGGPILGALAGAAPILPRHTALARTDACLGVAGLPQSATGQTTIFTGINAAEHLGLHLWAFPNARLRGLLAEHSLLRTARTAGHRVGFLNPFPPGYMQERDPARIGASTWAAVASGEPLRSAEDLAQGRAVSFDLTGDWLRARGWNAPRRTPVEAGRTLVRAARELDLALFEYWLSDRAGHSRDLCWAREEARRLRGMLDGVLEELGPGESVCVTSDHGNLEDLSTGGHTLNPVPTLWVGPDAAERARRCRTLTDITPTVLSSL